jgi:hypothetical protein
MAGIRLERRDVFARVKIWSVRRLVAALGYLGGGPS